ncbi:MAG: hypothetical protein ACRYG2_06110 [Janthinobacterium lividum]
MARKVLFDGTIDVSYRFIHMDSGVGGWDQEIDHRAHQRNGLAGGAQTGFVDLVVGTHSGAVPLRIELHRKVPRLDERWDEIVEVSCDLRGRRLEVSAFDSWLDPLKVRQNGPHRVRYSALRFDDEDGRSHREAVLDRYLVQLWPAPMAPDEVIKVTSERAASWHELDPGARTNPSLHEQAADERAEEEAERERRDADNRAFERERRLHRWGGREPSPRLLQVDPGASRLATRDRDLADAIEELPPERQRALALEVARRACAGDHDSPVDWSPALDALEHGQAVPAPFDDEDALRTAMFGTAPEVSYEGGFVSAASFEALPRPLIHTGVTAAAAVRRAADPDPFAAALGAIEAASWSAPDEHAFFAEVSALVR